MRRNVWKNLGYELSLSQRDLNIIRVHHKASVEAHCSKVLIELWLEKEVDASWEKLIGALSGVVGIHNLASRIGS